MANRYWVGGVGTWDTTTTTNWSATSGAAGGASVPTSVDDIFFDQAGTYTVTCTGALVCRDITVSAGVVTFSGGTSFTISGSMSLRTGTVWNGGSAAITFNATTTGKTITTNGTTLNGSVVFNGIGGVWTLGSALYVAYPATSSTTVTINVVKGTLNTGGYSFATQVSWAGANSINISGGILNLSSSIVNTLAFWVSSGVVNLGSSTIYVSAIGGGNGSPISISGGLIICGTSEIVLQMSHPLNPLGPFDGGGAKFYKVTYDQVGTNLSITGTNTFNTLTIRPSASKNNNLIFADDQIIDGTLSIQTTSSALFRTVIMSNTTLQPRKITCANFVGTNVDFLDINVVGAAAPISGTRLNDLKGNSGINFNPKTVYWNLAGAQNWSATGWASTSGGTPDVNNFPLAQDTCVFDDVGSVTGIITLDVGNIGTVDMSARTLPMTLSISGSTIFGNWVNGQRTNIIGAGTLTFSGRNTQTITSLGIPFRGPITIDSYSGTVTVSESFTTLSAFALNNGNFNLNNYNLAASTFTSSSNTIRSLQNCSNITLFGNNGVIWNTNAISNMKFTGIPNVNFVYAGSVGSRIIDGTFFPANFNILAGNDSISTTSGYNFDFTGFSGVWNQSSSVIYGSIKCSNLMTILVGGGTLTLQAYTSFGAYVPTTCTLDTAGKTFEFAVTLSTQASYFLRNDLQLGPTRTLTLNQGTLDLNGFNLSTGLFSSNASSTRLLNIGNSSFILSGTNATIWNTSNGSYLSIFANNPISCTGNITTGTRTISASVAVPVDFNILSGTDTVTITGAHSVNYTGWQGTMGTSTIYGNVVFGPGSLPTTNILNLNATAGVKTITSNGNIINFSLSLTGTPIYVLQDALNLGNPNAQFNINSGTLDANDYNVTAPYLATSGTFHIRSGTITITGLWMGIAGTLSQHTGSILFSNNSTSIRTFNSNGGFTYNKLIIGGVNNNSATTTIINGTDTFLEFNSTTTSAHNIMFANAVHTIKKWSITGSPEKFVRLSPATAGSSHTLNLLERVTDVDYLIIDGLVVTRAEFYAGRNSIRMNGLSNPGPLYFTEAPTVPKTYYCVGTTWDLTTSSTWSLTSGGPGGAGVPTSIDNVIINSSRSVSLSSGPGRCNNLTIMWQAGTVTLGSAGNETLYIFGNLDNQISTNLSPVTVRILCSPQFVSTKSGNKINFNGAGPGPGAAVYFDGIGGSWQLTSLMDVASYGASTLYLVNGTLDTGGTPLIAGAFNSNYTTNRTLLLGISTINLTSATPWTINPLNFNYVALKII